MKTMFPKHQERQTNLATQPNTTAHFDVKVETDLSDQCPASSSQPTKHEQDSLPECFISHIEYNNLIPVEREMKYVMCPDLDYTDSDFEEDTRVLDEEVKSLTSSCDKCKQPQSKDSAFENASIGFMKESLWKQMYKTHKEKKKNQRPFLSVSEISLDNQEEQKKSCVSVLCESETYNEERQRKSNFSFNETRMEIQQKQEKRLFPSSKEISSDNEERWRTSYVAWCETGLCKSQEQGTNFTPGPLSLSMGEHEVSSTVDDSEFSNMILSSTVNDHKFSVGVDTYKVETLQDDSLFNNYIRHGNKLFLKCEVCQRVFKSRAHLIMHMQTHTGKKIKIINTCHFPKKKTTL